MHLFTYYVYIPTHSPIHTHIHTADIYIYIYICVCVCVCGDRHFFAEGRHLLDLLREARVTHRAKYIRASSVACAANESAIFSVRIALVHLHMTSETCSRPTYFVTDITRVTCMLLQKDFNKNESSTVYCHGLALPCFFFFFFFSKGHLAFTQGKCY